MTEDHSPFKVSFASAPKIVTARLAKEHTTN
jgi:hypothetical protein